MLALLSEHAQQAEGCRPPQDATGGIYWDADSGQWHPVLPAFAVASTRASVPTTSCATPSATNATEHERNAIGYEVRAAQADVTAAASIDAAPDHYQHSTF